MKIFATTLGLLFVFAFTLDCDAQRPNRGKRQNQGNRPNQGQMKGPQATKDPAAMAQRMMQQFDKDGNQQLDAQELAAMFVAMQERRSNGRRGENQAGRGRRGGPGAQGNPQGRRGRRGAKGNGPKGQGKKKRDESGDDDSVVT